MMQYPQGNLLDAEVDALVNAVNTVGVMGKGIALQFKERFRPNFKAYEAACREGSVRVGRMFVTETGALCPPKWIINFPTKEHWRNPSRMEWIRDGLADLVRVIREKDIRSVAIPALGCGNGGLNWLEVKASIEDAFADLPDVAVVVFGPTGIFLGRL